MTHDAERRRGAEGCTSTRVRYPETDRMGVAHHAHYLVWFELGRTEWLRDLDLPYAEIEEEGVFLPVVEVGANYRAPARYDDRLLITTRLAWARGARMRLEYAVRREEDRVLLASGFTVHAAVDRRGKPRRLPQKLTRRLRGVELRSE